MKKKILLAVLIVCLMCGCSKTIPKLSNGNEAVVSFKDGSMISVDELYNKMKDSYATSILIEMIDTKILEDKYKDKLDEAKDSAENYVKTFKNAYTDENGKYDEDALISAINQYYGYSTLEDFEAGLKLTYLRNLAIEDYAKSKVTEKEIKKYYKDEVVGDREISHIQIIPEVKDNMTEHEKKAAEEKALNEAKEIVAKLKKGEKFEDLAKANSDDENTKEAGGSLGYINKGSYGSDEFDKSAFSLEVGKYTTTPVKTSKGYEIIYVTNAKDKKELDEVKDDIIETLAKEKIQDDATMQVDGIKALRKDYGVEIVDDEITKNYNSYMNRLYNSLVQENNK